MLGIIVLKPIKIQTDNGGEFRNTEMENYLKNLNIEFVHGRPSHPQSQGGVERFNCTILKLIQKNIDNIKPDNFNEILNDLLFSYNNSQHSITKFKPTEAFQVISKAEGYEEKVRQIIENTKKRSQKIALKLNFKEGEKVLYNFVDPG